MTNDPCIAIRLIARRRRGLHLLSNYTNSMLGLRQSLFAQGASANIVGAVKRVEQSFAQLTNVCYAKNLPTSIEHVQLPESILLTNIGVITKEQVGWCLRRLNIDHACRFKFDQGKKAQDLMLSCG